MYFAAQITCAVYVFNEKIKSCVTVKDCNYFDNVRLNKCSMAKWETWRKKQLCEMGFAVGGDYQSRKAAVIVL
jgi:hypothetical protein